jgi:hypothetical protein
MLESPAWLAERAQLGSQDTLILIENARGNSELC